MQRACLSAPVAEHACKVFASYASSSTDYAPTPHTRSLSKASLQCLTEIKLNLNKIQGLVLVRFQCFPWNYAKLRRSSRDLWTKQRLFTFTIRVICRGGGMIV